VTTGWTAGELERIGAAPELLIATTRADGSSRGWTPIWVVCVEGQVFVRTWHRRNTGWFGDAVRSGTARLQVPNLEAGITVIDTGAIPALRHRIDAAYRAKYGEAGSGSMVTDSAADSTLRLDRLPGRE
jgi:hypothetical protein